MKKAAGKTETLLRKARKSLKKGDLQRAREYYSAVLEAYPANKQAQRALADLQGEGAQGEEGAGAVSRTGDLPLRRLVALYQAGEFSEVTRRGAEYTKANPNEPLLYRTIAAAYTELAGLESALYHYLQADRLQPNNRDTCYDIGVVLLRSNRFDDALAWFEKALRLNPSNVNTRYNQACALKALGRLDEAIASFSAVLELQPEHRQAINNRATTLLSLGQFEQGWAGYLLAKPPAKVPFVTQNPIWHNSVAQGKLLVRSEQGIGDEIMFGSLLPRLKASYNDLIVQIDGRLLPVFQRVMPSIEFLSKKNALDDAQFDWYLPMESLGQLFCTNMADVRLIPRNFLKSSPTRVEQIRNTLSEKIDGENQYVVGISWKSVAQTHAQSRDIALLDLAVALAQPGVSLVSLQYGDVDEEITAVREQSGINIVQISEVDNFGDLDGLAALMDACDCVVSIDNATVHLAGALGRETCALLLYQTDWRWLHEANRSYWYPSVSLLRQRVRFDWSDVLTAAARYVAHRVSAKAQTIAV